MLILSALPFTSRLFAENTPDGWKTNGQLNGKFWQSADEAEKLVYLRAFDDGVMAGQAALAIALGPIPNESQAVRSVGQRYRASGSTLAERMAELNRLYAHQENLLVPIPFALEYCAEKLRGDVNSDLIEKRLADVRQAIAITVRMKQADSVEATN